MANKTAPNRMQMAHSASEARDLMVKDAMAKERIATEAKTVRLKALRLAREAEEAAIEAAKPKPVPKAKKPRKAAAA